MLNGYNCSHSVTDICTGKIRILFFQDSYLSRILVHDSCKGCLKSCQMCSALCIINIITKSKYILMKLIHILQCYLYFNPVCFPFKINRVMKYFFLTVQILDKSNDSFRFVINDVLNTSISLIIKHDRQIRIQIRSLMQTALNLFRFELRLLKDRIIRQKIYRCSRLSRLSDLRKKSIFQFDHRDSSLVPVMMNKSIPADLHIHISRKSIYNRGTYSVKSTTCLICRIIKLTTCMECRINQTSRRYTLLMHINRNSTTVI